jgi:arabinogalactan endo-1,4-beta-galactosidase
MQSKLVTLAASVLALAASLCNALPADQTSSQSSAIPPDKLPGEFLIGADVSWVPQQEAQGRRFSVDGVESDLLKILKEHNFNAVRLRIFVDPTAPGGYSSNGFCGMEATVAMARRVKAEGLQFLLDFHYSDTWSDPAHQKKPASWRELDFAGLTNAVLRYTQDTLTEFKRRNLTPDIVQVGNEISNGLLWPDGKSDDFDRLATLLAAGIRGVRETTPSAKVMLHLAWGGQNEKSRWFLDNAMKRGLDFDLIGQSYYPRWHGTLEDLRSNLTDLAARYRQGIIVVEYSTPLVREVNEIVRSLPGGKGLGTFIWEPTHPAHGNLFDRDGRALPALKEYLTLFTGAADRPDGTPSNKEKAPRPINR